MTVLSRAFSGYRLWMAVVLCAAFGMAATAAVIQLLDMTAQSHGAMRDGERLVRVRNTEVGADAARSSRGRASMT